MKDIAQFKINQFEQFYELLMKKAPKGYVPWFFPCEKNGKNPAPIRIIEIAPEKSLCCDSKWAFRITKEEAKQNKTLTDEKNKNKPKWICNKCEKAKGSWHSLHARLDKKQCIQHIKEGYNLGISARRDDSLILIDIDEPKYLDQVPKNTLTVLSRKRSGCHAFCWDKDGTAKINLPTDYGEMRSENQYVLACGSYVPFNLTKKKDKIAFEKLPKEAKEDKEIGFYTLRDKNLPRLITFSECPQFFQDKEKENKENEIIISQREEKKTYKDRGGRYSELFDLKVSDIVGMIPSSQRKGHPLHESDTDSNWSLTKDGSLGMCWRHLVSLNAVQYLCVMKGYAKCEDAGTPHDPQKTGKRGGSKIRGDKKALEVAYKVAVDAELINEWGGGFSNEGVREFLFSKGINSKTGREEFGVNLDMVADHFISQLQIKTWCGEKSDYSFNWNGKIMKRDTRGIVKFECEKLLNTFCKRNTVEEIYEKIKRKTKVDREEFETNDTNFINLNNGVWDIENKKLLDHDPKYNFQYAIGVNKNNDPLDVHDCPNWINFITETLYPADVPVMQEWFGFMFFREYFIKKAVICEGEQDTGKSVLLDTAIKFIGEENKTGLSLQKITNGSDFTKLSLKNKHLNAYDDLSSNDLSDGGAFKVATGGGYISGEEKFGEYQQFRSFAKQMFATNKIPPVKDNDDLAYFGRWIVLKFDNVPDKLDPFLRKKLWTDKEMSGILNWALEGLYRLLKNGKFSYNKTSEEVKQLMEISGCPLVAFSNDVLEREDGAIISKDDMFKFYSVWCEKNNRPRLSKEKLGRDLTKYCKFILPEKHKVRIWKNAKISQKFLKENNLHTTTHTSDTIQKVICCKKKDGNISDNNDNIDGNISDNNDDDIQDIIFNKVSEEPPKTVTATDTSDTNIKYCFSCKRPDAFIIFEDKLYCEDCIDSVSEPKQKNWESI